jgi:hypothetical protein
LRLYRYSAADITLKKEHCMGRGRKNRTNKMKMKKSQAKKKLRLKKKIAASKDKK